MLKFLVLPLLLFVTNPITSTPKESNASDKSITEMQTQSCFADFSRMQAVPIVITSPVWMCLGSCSGGYCCSIEPY